MLEFFSHSERMDAHLYLQADMQEPLEVRLSSGTACVFSRRAPLKEMPNADAAGLYDLGAAGLVLAVADGVGGHRGAEQASAITLETLARELEAVERNGTEVREALLNAVEAANRAVVELGIGAGTTLIAVEVRAQRIRTYHVGDSQALLAGRRGKLKLVTKAHSPIGYALEAGILAEEEALHHAERHLLSNMIGLEAMHIEMGSPLELAPLDTLVLGSDGLFDNLRLEEIVQTVRLGSAPRAAAALVAACQARMDEDVPEQPSKPDDLTAVLFRRHPTGTGRGRARPTTEETPTTTPGPPES